MIDLGEQPIRIYTRDQIELYNVPVWEMVEEWEHDFVRERVRLVAFLPIEFQVRGGWGPQDWENLLREWFGRIFRDSHLNLEDCVLGEVFDHDEYYEIMVIPELDK